MQIESAEPTEEVPVPDELLHSKEVQELVRSAVLKLDPRKKHVIYNLYGLEDEDPITMAELSRRMGISSARVKELRDKAFEFLHKWLYKRRCLRCSVCKRGFLSFTSWSHKNASVPLVGTYWCIECNTWRLMEVHFVRLYLTDL